jgi:hypothetical protein
LDNPLTARQVSGLEIFLAFLDTCPNEFLTIPVRMAQPGGRSGDRADGNSEQQEFIQISFFP